MRVGLTFFLHPTDTRSIWSNGGDQHLAFLYGLLGQCENVEVIAINGGNGPAPQPGLMYDRLGIKPEPISDALLDTLDVLIEGGAQVSAEHVDRVRRRGGKAIAFRYGNAYVIDAERVIHGKPSGSIFNGAQFDEIWTNAQHEDTCGSYWEIAYRCPVRIMPHIWEPTFVDAAIAEFPEDLRFGYRPSRGKKRISVLEPNHNIVKTCFIPMLACEQAYRQRPELVGDIYVTNAEQLKGHVTFKHFAGNLDIVKAGLASFEARRNTPFWLAKYTDVVVAHQWENGLNYAYYDVLYGGYPLVHNSPFLPVGYHYAGFDAHAGANALLSALANHDQQLFAYRRDANKFLDTVRASNPDNIRVHELALCSVRAEAA